MLSRSLLASDAPAVGYTVKTVPNYYRHLSLVVVTTITAEKLVPPLSTSPDNKHSLPPVPQLNVHLNAEEDHATMRTKGGPNEI